VVSADVAAHRPMHSAHFHLCEITSILLHTREPLPKEGEMRNSSLPEEQVARLLQLKKLLRKQKEAPTAGSGSPRVYAFEAPSRH
jgi:hypothetical protein